MGISQRHELIQISKALTFQKRQCFEINVNNQKYISQKNRKYQRAKIVSNYLTYRKIKHFEVKHVNDKQGMV